MKRLRDTGGKTKSTSSTVDFVSWRLQCASRGETCFVWPRTLFFVHFFLGCRFLFETPLFFIFFSRAFQQLHSGLCAGAIRPCIVLFSFLYFFNIDSGVVSLEVTRRCGETCTAICTSIGQCTIACTPPCLSVKDQLGLSLRCFRLCVIDLASL